MTKSREMTATDLPDASEVPTARLHALVIGERNVATYPLPDTGTITVGRSPQCEIQIDDASISRTHAAIAIGPPLAVRDLGSANGTRVRDRVLPRDQAVEIHAGEPIQVGAATIIIQRQVAAIRPRRLWTHDYFEVRLEEECARAARRDLVFAVTRVHCTAQVSADAIQHALGEVARLSDVIGEYGPSEYEILFVDTSPDDVELAERRVVTELSRHGVGVRVGTAFYPRDGRSADELMAHADALARGVAHGDLVEPDGEPAQASAMQDLYALAARVANGTIAVLILGETGVGKEVIAEKVHQLSPRGGKPYLRLNCAALSETLLESELFGYERGAFTGAVAAKPGLLETADGGSVFLDEVGELPLAMQVKLLRVIEERVVLRVGGLKPRPLDVRFISATNRNLEADIARGAFRQDLYFRLNGATLVIPPLRERLGEIPGLARAFLENAARQAALPRVPELSSAALHALLRYSWPGNIRELRNMMERAALLCPDGPVEQRHLPIEKMRVTFAAEVRVPAAPGRDDGAPSASNPVLRRGAKLSRSAERAQIQAALEKCGGNQTRAAKMLGIGRRTLINRVKEFGLARPRTPR
ncbi:MAG TPA: sigma 54-interacting transcriptional regulator [Kofleriaceae bacterium]|nr:sigma 54-interacting transcriptional regulator [Kofleriaceae bacterium]